MAKAELEQAIADLGLVVTAEFVPYSKSRSFKKDAKVSERNLNWRVSLKRMAKLAQDEYDDTSRRYKPGSERTILTTDYSAGIGHCPAYNASVKEMGNKDCVLRAEAIRYETEHGKAAFAATASGQILKRNDTPLLPGALDVIYSLVQDADVLNYATFEQWASDCGYDPDSRSAEKIYRACMETALALRNGVGDDGLRRLQEAAQDY